MTRGRLGVAILVPPPLAEEIDGLRRALGDGAFGRIPPHVTLVPPVNVAEADVTAALAVVRHAARAARPFRIGLAPPATFHPDNPVIYLPVSAGGDEVRALREGVFRDPLARPLAWPFVPHVTLADGADPSRIEPALEALADFRVEVTVEAIHLLREQPGRIWAPVADMALGRPSVVGTGGLPLEIAVSERADPEAAAWAGEAWRAYDGRAGLGGMSAVEAFAIVARREGSVVGLAEGKVRGRDCDLDRLIVGAADRRQGIGSHLLAAVETLAADRGCARCRLEAVTGGAAEGFYRDRGWVVTGELRDWRDGADYVRMERHIEALNRTE